METTAKVATTNETIHQRPPFLWIGIGVSIWISLFLILVVHARHYSPFLTDDALISLRYSQRLLQGHGLTWADGIPVEGYTNFLWVLLNAFIGALGVDLVTAARILGYVCMGGVIVGLLAIQPPSGWARIPTAIVGGLFFVASGSVAIWTIGGLEQPLILLLLVWAVFLGFIILEKDWPGWIPVLGLGLLLGLLIITRPDSLIFLLAFVVAVSLARGINKSTLRLTAALIVLPAVFLLAHTAFRLAYYGDWVPNAAYAKIILSWHHLRVGVQYLLDGLGSFTPFLEIAALVSILGILFRRQVKKIILLDALILSWAAYIVFVGGDIFPGWRQMIPLIIPLAVLTMIGMEWLMEEGRQRIRGRLPRTLAALGLAAMLGLEFAVYIDSQILNDGNQSAFGGMWVWDGKRVGEMLKAGFGRQQPLLAVDTAGSLPFWSELPAIDMLGLNDRYIAQHPPESAGGDPQGHGLGNGQYVFDRKPDLIMFCAPWGWRDACYQSGVQMQAMPEFHSEYTFSQFYYSDDVLLGIWIRRSSLRIGILQGQDEIEIPSYLLDGWSPFPIYQDSTGQFYVLVDSETSVFAKGIHLPAGIWEVQPVCTAPVDVQINAGDGMLFYGLSSDGIRVAVPADLNADIYVFSHYGDPSDLTRISLHRIGDA
jgi:arabinofuranosyltransferase